MTLKTIYLHCFVFLTTFFNGQNVTTIYFFPGQGSDERIFSEIKPDSNFKTVFIKYPVPRRGATIKDFAEILLPQIDTTNKYIFVGVSLGGMICTELTGILKPQKTIVISGAKCRQELPLRYRFQKTIPLYKLFPGCIIRGGAKMLQPIVEPDRKKNKMVFKSMLRSKSPQYYKRTVSMIIRWDRTSYNERIIHIHGTKDHTIPVRNVKANYKVDKGSHMMTLTRGKEINLLLKNILSSN